MQPGQLLEYRPECVLCGHSGPMTRRTATAGEAPIWGDDRIGWRCDDEHVCLLRMASPTMAYVLKFARLMENKFALNRHKGDRPGWLAMSAWDIRAKLLDEVGELDEALGEWLGAPTPENARALAMECADVGNYALELADRVGGLDV